MLEVGDLLVRSEKETHRREVDIKMMSSSFNLEDLSPRSRLMVEYMKKLEAKMKKLERGLEFVKLDLYSVNARIRSWSKTRKRRKEVTPWFGEMKLPCRLSHENTFIESWE
ncbi:hypothetical protein CR513_32766, partial [Mucuna pruriens]